MNKLTIKQRVVVGFSIILALVTCSAIASFLLLRQSRIESNFMSTDALPGSVAMIEIDHTMTQIHIDVLRVLLAKTPEDRKKFEDEIAAHRTDIGNLITDYEKTVHLAEERAMLAELKAAREKYIADRDKLFELCEAGKSTEAEAYNASVLRPDYMAYSGVTGKMLKWNLDNALQSSARSDRAVSRANYVSGILSLVVVALGIALALMIAIGLNRVLSRVASSLGDGSSQVASAASQVSSASESLARGASEQAASIEETSSSLEEMASMTKRNSENAQKANDLARQARDAAERGVVDMQSMSTAMEAIKASGDDIAKIIRTIDEIAFQTNILALNAAVEAARAGEAGMGFAVVADEVRNLAQRSAQAAKETALKIEGAITRTSQGVEISSKVAEVLNEIVVKARQVDELAAEVASASREQTQGITQINIAVGQMDKVTQSNAANAEESAAAAEELNAQAASMNQSVRELMQLVEGRIASGTGGRPITVKKTGAPRTTPAGASPTNGTARIGDNNHALALETARRNEIPLEADFKNF